MQTATECYKRANELKSGFGDLSTASFSVSTGGTQCYMNTEENFSNNFVLQVLGNLDGTQQLFMFQGTYRVNVCYMCGRTDYRFRQSGSDSAEVFSTCTHFSHMNTEDNFSK